jgi:hypothetical protein
LISVRCHLFMIPLAETSFY